MNQAIQAIHNLDQQEAKQEQKISQARAIRRALPTAKNAELSEMASHGIADSSKEIERLTDERTVVLTDLDMTMGERIREEAAIRDRLMDQLDESQQRLKRLESEKVRRMVEEREKYTHEIAEAEKTIAGFEALAGVLAKPVE